MTILEAIQSNPVLINVPQKFIESVLIGRSINGGERHSEVSLELMELATADLYMVVANTPDFKEGTLSISYNSDMLKAMALGLYAKYNDPRSQTERYTKIEVGITAVDYDS